MTKNIIFDFGGVLMDWDPRYFYRRVFESEQEMEYFLTHICTPEWNEAHDRGVSFADNIAALQAKFPKYSREIGLYRKGWSTMLRSDKPESVAIFHKLLRQGYPVYGLTNWSAETFDELLTRYPFFTLMKGIVVSGQEGFVKPDPRLYQILLQRYGLKPDECLFIDDNLRNVEAARSLGMRAHRFVSADGLRQYLVEEAHCLPPA